MVTPISAVTREKIKRLADEMSSLVLSNNAPLLGELMLDVTAAVLAAGGGGEDWQESVKDKDLVASPAVPATGDRYLIAGIGGAWATFTIGDIVQYDGGMWTNVHPTEGFTVEVMDEDKWYYYNGTVWGVLPPLYWDRTGTTLSPTVAGTDVDLGTGDLKADQVLSKTAPIYNAKQWGVTGNGATDDSAAIQAMVTAAVVAGGGTIYFPAGIYHCHTAIDINNGAGSPLAIIGDGETSPGTVFDFTACASGNGFININRGVQMECFRMNMPAVPVLGSAAISVIGAGTLYVTIRRLRINSAYNALYLPNISYLSVSQCYLSGITTSNVGLTISGSLITVDNVYSTNGAIGCDMGTTSQCTIQDSTFESTLVAALRMNNVEAVFTNVKFNVTNGNGLFIDNELGTNRCTLVDCKFLVGGTQYSPRGIIYPNQFVMLSSNISWPSQIYGSDCGDGALFNLPILESYTTMQLNIGAIRAQGTLSFTGLPGNGETFRVDATTFTMKNAPVGANDIAIGIDVDTTCRNIFRKCCLRNTTAISFTPTSVTWRYYLGGVAGNAIIFTEGLTNATMDGGGFLGGTVLGVAGKSGILLDNTGDTTIYGIEKIDTINEKTLNAGVTIDTLLLKDGLCDGVDVSTLPGAIAAKLDSADFTSANVTAKVLGAGYLASAGVVAIGDALEVALEKLDGNVAATVIVANAALPKAGGQISGNITCAGAETFDGVDLSALPTAANMMKRVEVTKTISNFATPALTSTINVFSLPAGAALKDLYARVTAAFTNPAATENFATDGTATGTFQIVSPTGFAADDFVTIDTNPATGAVTGYIERIYLGAGAAAYDLDALVDGTAGGVITVGDPIGPIGLGLPAFTVGDYLVVDNAPTLLEAFGCLVSKTDVTAASGVASIGTLQAVALAAGLVAGQTFSLSDGVTDNFFEITVDGSAFLPGHIPVALFTGDDAAAVHAAILLAINVTAGVFGVTAAGVSPNVTLTNDANGTIGNVTIIESLGAGVTLTPVGMIGGTDAWELHIHDNLGATMANLNLAAYTVILGARVYSTAMDMVHITVAAGGGGGDVDLSTYDVAVDASRMFFGLTACTIEMGVIGDTDKYIVAARDVSTAPIFIGLAADKGVVIADGTTNIESFGAATDIVCKMDSVGALLSDLTAGSITFFMEYVG